MNRDLIMETGLFAQIDSGNPDAEAAAAELLAGGVRGLQLSWSCRGEALLPRLAKAFPQAVFAVTGVESLEQAMTAKQAGARCIIAAGADIAPCGSEVIPCCATVRQVEQAAEAGCETVCLLPGREAAALAEIIGGFAGINFYCIGDFSPELFRQCYPQENLLAFGVKLSGGEQARAAVRAMHNMELVHIGLNMEPGVEALPLAQVFCGMFDLDIRETPTAYFAGQGMELMKQPGAGKYGHLAIGVNHLPRAMAWLKAKGVAFRPESMQYMASGRPLVIYLKEEYTGFAIHLMQR